MSARGSLRVLVHKPLLRATEPYFRVQQYVAAFERLGHRPDVLDFGRLRDRRESKIGGILRQVIMSARAFRRYDVVMITPHPLALVYIVLAKNAGCRVIIDQILTYVSHREVFHWFPRPVDRWSYRLADGILTHSETMRGELRAAFALDPARIVVAYPVLDLEMFSRRYDGEARALRQALGIGDRLVVLYHGMWHPWHGLRYLYDAARLLEDHGDIVFVVIPKDGEPNRANLVFVEEQPFERLPVHLQMADLWCSGFDTDPRGERAFSSTLIQALALGLPVITGRAGERATVLRDGVDVRFVPLRDPSAIASAILDLAAHGDTARRIGRQARAFAESHFSIARLDEALRTVLARAVDGDAAGENNR